MTTATVAYRAESAFNSPGTGDWIQPGTDVSVSSAQIDNQLQRSRQPDQSRPADSRPGNARLSATVEFTVTDKSWTDLLPTDGSVIGGTGVPPTAEWHFDSDILDGSLSAGTEGVTFAGTAIQQADIQVQEDGPVTVTLTLRGTDLSGNSPESVVQPDPADEFLGHGAELTIDSTVQIGLSSATLSVSGLAERAEEPGRTPRALYVGAVDPTLQTTADTTEVDQLQLAAGGDETTVADTLSGPVSGSLVLENRAASTQTWDLSGLVPNTFSFDQVVSPQDLLGESVNYQLTDIGVPA